MFSVVGLGGGTATIGFDPAFRSNVLFVNPAGGQWLGLANTNPKYFNFTDIKMQARIGDGRGVLLARVSGGIDPSGFPQNCYIFQVVPSQPNAVSLFKIVNGVASVLKSTNPPAMNGGDYTLRFEVLGNHLYGYINGGAPIIDAPDNSLSQGTFGIMGFANTTKYDDLLVNPALTCAVSTMTSTPTPSPTPLDTHTASPTVTATPTATPTPVCNGNCGTQFCGTFENIPSGDIGGAAFIANNFYMNGSGSAKVTFDPAFTSHVLLVQPIGGLWLGLGDKMPEFANMADMVISARVRAARGVLLARISGGINGTGYPNFGYIFEAYPGGAANIAIVGYGIATIIRTGTDVSGASASDFRLRFEAVGNTLKGYINDVLAVSVADSTFASGTFGLMAYSVPTVYDDVLVNAGTVCASPTYTSTLTTSPTQSNTDTITASPTRTETPALTSYFWKMTIQNTSAQACINCVVQVSDGSGYVDMQARYLANKINPDGSDIRIQDELDNYVNFDLVTNPQQMNTIIRFKVPYIAACPTPGSCPVLIYTMTFGKNSNVAFPAGYGTTSYLQSIYKLADTFEGSSLPSNLNISSSGGTATVSGGNLSIPNNFTADVTSPAMDTSYGVRFEFKGNGGNTGLLQGSFQWTLFQDLSNHFNMFRNNTSPSPNEFMTVALTTGATGLGHGFQNIFGPNNQKYFVSKVAPGVFLGGKDQGDPAVAGKDFGDVDGINTGTNSDGFTGGNLHLACTATTGPAVFEWLIGYELHQNGPTAILQTKHPIILGQLTPTNDPVFETEWHGFGYEVPMHVTAPAFVAEIRGFNDPVDLALGMNSIYVLDRHTGLIKVFSTADYQLQDVLHAGLSNPEAIAFDSFRNWIWIADSGNKRVIAMDLTGTLKAAVSSSDAPLGKPTGVAVDKRGWVYVVDQGRSMLSAFNETLALQWSEGGRGYEVTKFETPYHVSVADNEMLYVSDPGNARVAAWSTYGFPVRQLPRASMVPFMTSGALSVALLKGIDPVILDSGNGRIVYTESNGNFIGAGDSGIFNNPAGIAMASCDDIWVADTGNHRVIRLQRSSNPGQGGMGVAKIDASRPVAKSLLPSGKSFIGYPNPAKDQVQALFKLDAPGSVKINVMSLSGSLVKTIDLGQRPAGESNSRIDTKDLASGIYFLALQVNDDSGYRPRAIFKLAVVR